MRGEGVSRVSSFTAESKDGDRTVGTSAVCLHFPPVHASISRFSLGDQFALQSLCSFIINHQSRPPHGVEGVMQSLVLVVEALAGVVKLSM